MSKRRKLPDFGQSPRRRRPNLRLVGAPKQKRSRRWVPGAAAIAAALSLAAWSSSDDPLLRALLGDGANGAKTFTCDVAHVSDGDTLRCADGTRVRLSGIAAREKDGTCSPGHPCPDASAAAARSALVSLTAGKSLRCEANGKSYDRVTAWCRTPSGEDLSCAMIETGTALRWEQYDKSGRLKACQSSE